MVNLLSFFLIYVKDDRTRRKNSRPCLELIFFKFSIKKLVKSFRHTTCWQVFKIKLTDLPVKYGRKQLRKANTRTTLGPESPILNWRDGALMIFTTLISRKFTLSKFSFGKTRQIVAGYGAKFKHASSLHSITNQTELQVLVLKSQQLRTAVGGAADGLAPVIPGPSHSTELLGPNNFLSARAHSSYGFVQENCPKVWIL